VKFYEIGPGKVLQGLIKRTLDDVEVAGFDKLSDIQNLKDELV
jgi:malonyl CoA-acyl carrier protein transacylase